MQIMRIVKNSPILALVLAVGIVMLPAQADTKTVYKWRDADGQVHYSERKPVGVQAEAFKVTAGSPGSNDQTPAPANTNATTNNAANNTAATQPDPNEFKDPERCDAAKRNLDTLSNNARIRMKDPKTGEFRFLDQSEIAKQKQEAQQAIDESC